MKNLELKVEGDILTIRVNLAEEHGLSRSGRSVIVASSEGNLPLVNPNGTYRHEKMNLSISKLVKFASSDSDIPNPTY